MKREQLNELKSQTKYLQHWYENRLSINLINNETRNISEKSEGSIVDLMDLVGFLEEMSDEQLKKYDIHIEIIEGKFG
jgi:hypothetical protein